MVWRVALSSAADALFPTAGRSDTVYRRHRSILRFDYDAERGDSGDDTKDERENDYSQAARYVALLRSFLDLPGSVCRSERTVSDRTILISS